MNSQDVKEYLIDFRQKVEERIAHAESQARFANDSAETAVIGIAENKRELERLKTLANDTKSVLEQRLTKFENDTAGLFRTEMADVRNQLNDSRNQQNNRTRIWIAAFGVATVVVSGTFSLIDRWASNHAREQIQHICQEQILNTVPKRDEQDRQIEKAVESALNRQTTLHVDTITGRR